MFLTGLCENPIRMIWHFRVLRRIFFCKIQPIKIKVEFQVGLIITTEKLCKNYSVHQEHSLTVM